MWNPFKPNESLKDLQSLPQLTEMRIVCGDCAGDEIAAQETGLMSDGSCANCGGRSFVCAERYSMVLARHLLSMTTEKIEVIK